ncbi:MAG: hypothetical protein K6E73_12445 [Bacteroidales bacterium]|nr:hypothetical protein [Bacteroidales bacterium]
MVTFSAASSSERPENRVAERGKRFPCPSEASWESVAHCYAVFSEML